MNPIKKIGKAVADHYNKIAAPPSRKIERYTKTCPFCSKKADADMFSSRVPDYDVFICANCSTTLYFKGDVLFIYVIVIEQGQTYELEGTNHLFPDSYNIICEIGPCVSAIYKNNELINKEMPQIFTPEEAKRKLKTLLVFS